MIEHLKQTKAGFTLVELIVVIAILAILSGIAIPVYSGYISKANEAADLQLLSAVNTAWAAACAGTGMNPVGVIATATLSAEKKVIGVSATGVDTDANDALNTGFMSFFGDNTDTAFKVYNSLAYDTNNGVFVDGASEVTVSYNGSPISVTMSQLNAFQMSTFDEIGFVKLGADVNMVATAAAGVLGNGTRLYNNRENENSIASELYPYLHDTLKLSDEQIQNLNATQVANAMILYTASNTNKSTDIAAAVEQLKTHGTLPDLSNTSHATAALSTNLAFAYGIMESFINSGYATEAQKDKFQKAKINSEMDVYFLAYDVMFVPGSETPESHFVDYMSEDGYSDMNGYFSALSMIENNANNLSNENLLMLLTEGFSEGSGFYTTLGDLLGD